MFMTLFDHSLTGEGIIIFVDSQGNLFINVIKEFRHTQTKEGIQDLWLYFFKENNLFMFESHPLK